MNLKNLNYSPVLESESKNAFKFLNDINFPNRRQEKWKYSKFSKLKKTTFHNQHNFNLNDLSNISLPVMDGSIIVVENGKINNSLTNIISENNLSITSFSENKDINTSINNYNNDWDNYFSYLNQSYLEDGILIKVNDNSNIDQTINIIYISTLQNFLSNTRLNIIIGNNSSLELKQCFIDKPGIVNCFNCYHTI